MSYIRKMSLAIWLIPAIAMGAGTGVDIGSDASKDHKTGESTKITREKSASQNRDQKSSDRHGNEQSNEFRRESAESQSNRSGRDFRYLNAFAYGYNGVTALLKALSELEKTDKDFKSCAILSKSMSNDFPFYETFTERITFISDALKDPRFKFKFFSYSPDPTKMYGNNMSLMNVEYPAMIAVDDIEPEFDKLKSYFQCWVYYGELLASAADEIKDYGTFASEKDVVQVAKQIFRKYNADQNFRDGLFVQTSDIDSCMIPTSDGLKQAPLVIQCGSIRIYPQLATAEMYGSPLFNGQSIKGRLLRVDISSTASAHVGVENSNDTRKSSGTSSRTFSAHDQSIEDGRSLSIRKAQSNDQSISSDQDIKSSQSFKATPP